MQLTPSSKAGVALDSSYGLQCLEMFLATSDLTPTYYDVIVFNFGLHDIDYLEKYPEVCCLLQDFFVLSFEIKRDFVLRRKSVEKIVSKNLKNFFHCFPAFSSYFMFCKAKISFSSFSPLRLLSFTKVKVVELNKNNRT